MLHVTLKPIDSTDSQNNLEFDVPAILGRSKMADVRIEHPLISRKHCRFTESSDGQLVVEDLESLNGTYVEESRIKVSVLAQNAELVCGPHIFRVQYTSEQAEEAPTKRMIRRFDSEDDATHLGKSPLRTLQVDKKTNSIEVPQFGESPKPVVGEDDGALQEFFKKLT